MKQTHRKGIPLLVCDCSRPNGTPLVVKYKLAMRLQNSMGGKVHLQNFTVSQDRKRVTGICPICKRFADIQFAQAIRYYPQPPITPKLVEIYLTPKLVEIYLTEELTSVLSR